MSRIRVLVTDPAGNIYGQLPASRVGTFTRNLTEPDSLNIAANPDELGELAVVDREIQVWLDDEPSPRFVGIPFTASKALGGRRVTIPVEGLEAYFTRWRIDEDLVYTGVDQHNIGAQVLAWAQARPVAGAAVANIDAAAFALSGVVRDWTWRGDELPTVHEALDRWRRIDNGYDWTIEPVGQDRREWTPYYPRRGTARTWRLHHEPGRPGNVASVGYDVDGSQVTRRHHATSTGSGEGPDKLIGTYIDPDLATSGAALLESASSESTSITDTATLVEHARAQVEARSGAVRVWQALVTDPAIALTVALGDTFEVDLSDGWQSYAGTARVHSITLDPAAERASLTLTEED